MKAKTENKKVNLNVLTFVLCAGLTLYPAVLSAQEVAPVTLLKSDIRITNVVIPEIKMNTIQGTPGTLVGCSAGNLINDKFFYGISVGVNLTHPRVNYGYIGGIAQYILFSGRLVHLSGQLLIAYGSTKDYEEPREGLFDNFWNISGEDFVIKEPGVNIEVNLKKNLTLIAGVSYRWVARLDSNNENVRYTHVTNQDMQGVNFNIGLRFSSERKTKNQK
jgi:hypothetical protein